MPDYDYYHTTQGLRFRFSNIQLVKAVIRNDMKDGQCAYYQRGGVLYKMGHGYIKKLKVRNLTTLMRNWQSKPTFVGIDEQLLVHNMEQDVWGQEPFMVDLKDFPKDWWHDDDD